MLKQLNQKTGEVVGGAARSLSTVATAMTRRMLPAWPLGLRGRGPRGRAASPMLKSDNENSLAQDFEYG
jgi:hypothetical protein